MTNLRTDEGEVNTEDEFFARAIARAQRTARKKGYIRTSSPLFGVAEKESVGEIAGTSEENAVDVTDEDATEVDSGVSEGYEELQALERARIRAQKKWVKSAGLAPMRTKLRSIAKLDDVLKKMVVRNQWDTPQKMGIIMAQWPKIVGPHVAAHSHVETFDDHTLVVRCTSTAWAKELHLQLQRIERRIDEEVGPGVVEKVVIRGPVAPSWRKGPISVRGRGPRDTYG